MIKFVTELFKLRWNKIILYDVLLRIVCSKITLSKYEEYKYKRAKITQYHYEKEDHI